MAEQGRPWWEADEAPQDAGSTVTTAPPPPPIPIIPTVVPGCTCRDCAPDQEEEEEEEEENYQGCTGDGNRRYRGGRHDYRCRDCEGRPTYWEAPRGIEETCDHDYSCPNCSECTSEEHDCQECGSQRNCDHVYECDECPAIMPPG